MADTVNSLLFETKLQIPALRSGVLRRERLVERMQLRADTKLILISAPAGYGKTTLLSQWAAEQTSPVAWFSIDEGDNDPVRFLSYLIAALQRVDESLGQAALSLLQSPPIPLTASGPPPASDPFETCLAALIEDLLWTPDSLAVVLDDYHLIQDEAVHQMLRLLLDCQPAQLTLVIGTRQEPSIPIPRLRARDQIVEIRERDLKFTSEEATEFLKVFDLPAETVSMIEKRTEGWAAGLQLAGLSLQGYADVKSFVQVFSGDDRQVADYLLDEVLRYQSSTIQDFLLCTSILKKLSGTLCDAVLDLSGNSQALLEKLDASQLFVIPLDNKREWYRYHHLFAEFLQARLKKEYPEQLAGLHRRASQWHEAAGDIEEAVEHAFAVPDVERVIFLLEQYGTIMIFDGRLATYLNWIRSIPHEAIFRHVPLCVDCSWAFALGGQVALAEKFALAGKDAIGSAEAIHISSRGQVIPLDEVLGDLTSVQAYCARLRGDSEGVRRYSQEALQQLPADAYTVRGVVALNLGLEYYQGWEWEEAAHAFHQSVEMILKAHENLYVAIVALCMLGSIHAHGGELHVAEDYFKQAIALGEEHPIPSACLGYRGLAEIHYLRNQVEEAVTLLETALHLARRSGNTDILYNIFQLSAWLALLKGDNSGAERAIQKAEEHFPTLLDATRNPDMVTLRAAGLLMRDMPSAAIQTLEKAGISAADISSSVLTSKDIMQSMQGYLLLAHALLLENRTAAARQLLETLQPDIAASRDTRMLIEAQLLNAVLLEKQNKPEDAHKILNEALQLAEPSGYLSPFLSIGKPACELIRREALTSGAKSDYAQKVMAAFAGQSRRARESSLTESDLLSGVERLTRQETQILRLLSQGLSSTEVAAELVIAVSTARSYIKSIHRKLNAHSREEVIARGKQLGLI